MKVITSSGWLIRKRDPSMEDIMNKTLIAVATAVLAVTTLFASAAEAGFKIRLGFGGPLPGFGAHGGSGHYAHRRWRKRQYIVRRKAKPKVYVAKKATSSKSDVAKVEEAPKPLVDTAETENSSIATAAVAETEAGRRRGHCGYDKTASGRAERPQPRRRCCCTADEPNTPGEARCKKPSSCADLTVPYE
jgi:hypothetical protein